MDGASFMKQKDEQIKKQKAQVEMNMMKEAVSKK